MQDDAANPEQDGEWEPDQEHDLAELRHGGGGHQQSADAGRGQRKPLLHRLKPEHQQLVDPSVLLDEQSHSQGEQVFRMQVVLDVVVHLVPLDQQYHERVE